MLPEPTLIERSETFAEHLAKLVQPLDPPPTAPPAAACNHACALSIEHAHAVRMLVATSAFHSATLMLQAQYDALLQATWALYAAEAAQLAPPVPSPDADAPPAPLRRPRPAEMLKALARRARAVPGLIALVGPLQTMHADPWQQRAARVRAGQRLQLGGVDGLPLQPVEPLLRASNGLLHLAFRLLARLGSPPPLVAKVDGIFIAFTDCVPGV